MPHDTPAPAAESLGNDDDVILGLFREWTVAKRLAEAQNDADPDAEYAAIFAPVERLVAAIGETRASGATGLAIKGYLGIHELCVEARPDIAAIPVDNTLEDH